ncbi:Na+/H+ antiporter NhaA [Subtercola frigoramans]|uniref:Na(+)/H(+) antiporter NhaA n=1 Tax=Subtercola frigoramans TaxID=120298 RepID=A0ABS2L4E9_9MICO|nr:Na+/H+ antiporter NhaA [Subtercola frigoramans]MBM7471620.1 NhaA family Na+:H+ antiporter [Subtercola frigoramans]
MSIFRSERNSAGLLLAAAALGLILANTKAGAGLLEANDAHIGFPTLGLDLSTGHWISDGLLVIFFFIVAVELKYELVAGSLNSPTKAILPAIAALGGVVVPAGIYLLLNAGGPYLGGWPIPTATDIAFALGVLAIFGRALPTKVRVFLLALAVLDDLVAILIIAFFFTTSLNLLALGGAILGVVVFGALSQLLSGRLLGRMLGTAPTGALKVILCAFMVLVAILTWDFMYQSGVHATIAGVALGLVMARKPGASAAHALQPWSNAVVLPLFAFSAALVAIPSVGIAELSPAFWGVLVALPVGKLLGITLAGWIGARTVGRSSDASSLLSLKDLVMVGGLGGIGFTVSLLMNELAFAGVHEVADEGTIAVLLGSGVSIVAAAILVSMRSRAYKRERVAGRTTALVE